MPLLQQEASSAEVAPSSSQQRQFSQSTQETNAQAPAGTANPQDTADHNETSAEQGQEDRSVLGDMLDPIFIGRTIKLVRKDGWEEDIIQQPNKETFVLYENQRG